MTNSKLDIRGGDTVELKDGSIVTVADIHNKHIVVTFVERYPFEDVVRIVKKFGES